MHLLTAAWICVSAVSGDPHWSESFVWGSYDGHVAITEDYKSGRTMAEIECELAHDGEDCQTRCWRATR